MTLYWPPREPVRFWMMSIWLAILAVAGGASRADESQQTFVRLAGILLVVLTLWTPQWTRLRRQWPVLMFVAACVGLIALQLVPLPFAMWRGMPGHAFYADLGQSIGVAPTPRPWSMTPDLTVNALLAWLTPVATLVAILSMPRADRPLLLVALFVLAIVDAAMGLGQLAGGPYSPLRLYRITNADDAVGLFANRNHHALMAAIGISLLGPIRSALIRRECPHVFATALTFFTGVLFALSVLAAGSRGGLIAALCAVAGTGVWSIADARLAPRGQSRHALFTAAALLLPAGLMALAIAGAHAPALERLLGTHPTEESRYAWLPALLKTAEAFLPLGSGFGSFDQVYRRFEGTSTLNLHYANAAHNDLVQIAIEGGMPALALLAVFAIWWFRSGISLCLRGSGTASGIGRLGLLQSALILGFSLVDYPLRTPLFGAVFVIACTAMLREPLASPLRYRAEDSSTTEPARAAADPETAPRYPQGVPA